MAAKTTDSNPKAGDRYRCEQCGMELRVESDCQSNQGTRFECCGQQMSKA